MLKYIAFFNEHFYNWHCWNDRVPFIKISIKQNFNITGMDNFNNYYDINLKKSRADILKNYNIEIIKSDLLITNNDQWKNILKNIDIVIHLVSHANPRHALENQQTY